MNIEDKIAKIIKENSGSIIHPKGHVVLTLDPQDLKDLTKSLVKNLGLFSVSGSYSELQMKAAFEAGVYYERSCEHYSKQPKVTMAGHLVSNPTPDFSEFINNL